MSLCWLLLSCSTDERPPRALLAMAGDILARADADQDGLISLAEYADISFPDDPIRTYDLDKNGGIDMDELVKMLQETDPAWQQDTRRRRRPNGSQR